MNWRTGCIAVIPCLNEQAAISAVVEGVRKHLDTVLVVDDGSTDGTRDVAMEAGAEVVGHASTQGKGAALLTGWTQARERGFTWALTLDGDGQHASEDIPRFFEAANQDSIALVVGNRMGDLSQMPPVRRWVNRWLSQQLSNAVGRPLPDSQCGFRLMRLDAWASLGLVTRHFEIESEVLLEFVRAGYAVEFVPIRAIYKNEQSKIHPVRDTVRWFRWWRRAKRAAGTKTVRLV